MGVSCAGTVARGPVVTPDGVRFTLEHSGARSVSVAGDFNDWSPSAHPLMRNGSEDGLSSWRCRPGAQVHVRRRRRAVDGSSTGEDYVDDGFGSRNGVVIVR